MSTWVDICQCGPVDTESGLPKHCLRAVLSGHTAAWSLRGRQERKRVNNTLVTLDWKIPGEWVGIWQCGPVDTVSGLPKHCLRAVWTGRSAVWSLRGRQDQQRVNNTHCRQRDAACPGSPSPPQDPPVAACEGGVRRSLRHELLKRVLDSDDYFLAGKFLLKTMMFR